MAPQKVTEKILADARKESEEILNGYKKEAAKIKHEYEDKIAAKSEQIESEVEVLKKRELLRTVSQKMLEFKKEIVAQKRKYIKNVIEEALKELPKHKEYFSFLKALMEKSANSS
jgi:vacuolar-type H+-ATPase subunit E/Vma4